MGSIVKWTGLLTLCIVVFSAGCQESADEPASLFEGAAVVQESQLQAWYSDLGSGTDDAVADALGLKATLSLRDGGTYELTMSSHSFHDSVSGSWTMDEQNSSLTLSDSGFLGPLLMTNDGETLVGDFVLHGVSLPVFFDKVD